MRFDRFACWYRALLPFVAVALVCGCGHGPEGAAEGEKGAGEEAAAVEVQTVPAEERTVEEVVHAIGRSEALPNRLITLTPAVAGHVHDIPARIGEAVHRGDTIVRLDTEVASADVAEKEAQRNTLQAALELLVAEPRPEDRRALEVAVDQAKVAVTRADAMLERLKPLRARNEVSPAQWFEIEQGLADAKLRQQSAEAQLQLLLVGPRREAVAEAKARLAAAEQLLTAARANLALHELRSPIDGIVDSLNCHPGQAISVGTVVAEVVDPSELYVTAWLPVRSAEQIKPGQAATISIGDAPPASSEAAEHEEKAEHQDKADHEKGEHDKAEHDKAEHDEKAEHEKAEHEKAEHEKAEHEKAEHGKEGENKKERAGTPEPEKARQAEAAPDVKETAAEKHAGGEHAEPAHDGGPAAELPPAKVLSVGRIVDAQTGNLPVRVQLENKDDRVAVGQTVSVSIVVGTKEKALVVPARALFDLGEGPLLIVVREGKVVHLHPESADNHGSWTVITGTDLQPGERVVVDGGFNLPEETPVKESAEPAAVAEATR